MRRFCSLLAIDQTSHQLFGLTPSRLRLFATPPIVSAGTGLLLAKVFPDIRGSGVLQTKGGLPLVGWCHPRPCPVWKILHRRSLHRVGLFDGPRGSVSRDRGRSGVDPRPVTEAVARSRAGSRSRWRRRCSGRGVQDTGRRRPVRARGNHRRHEYRVTRIDRRRLGRCGDRGTVDFWATSRCFTCPSITWCILRSSRRMQCSGSSADASRWCSARDCWHCVPASFGLPTSMRIFQHTMEGLVIGVVLVFAPAIMGVGYDYVDQALSGGLVLRTLAALCALKLGATMVSYASGNAGGIFAPRLYIGALLHQDGVHLPSPATQALTTNSARHVMHTNVAFMPRGSVDRGSMAPQPRRRETCLSDRHPRSTVRFDYARTPLRIGHSWNRRSTCCLDRRWRGSCTSGPSDRYRPLAIRPMRGPPRRG